MFETLPEMANDPIMHLMGLCQADPRTDKIDLGVGVFKDASGNTPIMRAVSLAEAKFHEQQTTKAYIGMAGVETFNAAMCQLVFGTSVDHERLRAVQTPGGSGALRIAADMLHKLSEKTVWVSDPTWGNHIAVFTAAGLTVNTYPYLNRDTKTVDEAQLIDMLSDKGENDVILLHGCCHNPTGANLSLAAWERITELALEKGFLPLVDIAYQGLGDGLDEDLIGMRKMAAALPEMIVTASCSKNFGLYRDRVGCVMVLGATGETAQLAKSQLMSAARVSYSMPPDHGGAIVSMILNDAELRHTWEAELTVMRDRVLALRKSLSMRLAEHTQTNDWDFIADHRGMFSLLCLTDNVTDALIKEHAIYVVKGGRINIAGLKDDAQVERFASCLADVLQK